MAYVRPTLISASRASIIDENKRKEKAEKQAASAILKKNAADTKVKPLLQNQTKLKGNSKGEVPGKFHHVENSNHGEKMSTYRRQNRSRATTAGAQTQQGVTRQAATKSAIPASRATLYRDNLDFYCNKIHSKPLPGHTVEDMLKWKGDYHMLERNHRYIQWLFPIPEGSGLNLDAQQLVEHEAQAIRDDDKMRMRVLKAYKMMLDFYGMELVNSDIGTVKRSKCWEERYSHLNRSRHNLLRITRILKSIGELGYERFQAPWVNFLIQEAVIENVLPNLNGPCLYHWIMAVKDDGEKQMLYRKAHGLPINEQSITEDVDSEPEDEEEEKQKNPGNVAVEVKHKNADKLSSQLLSTESNLKTGEIRPTFTVAIGQSLAQVKLEDTDDKQEKESEKKDAATHSDEMDSERPSDNLKFYQDKLLSRPSPGFSIETMLKHKGDFHFFEEYPFYIQWLFPVPEKSVRNKGAQELYDHEAKAIREDDKLSARVLEAYKLLLDYYGMRLCDDVSGEVARVKGKYKERYECFQRDTENYLRITRILKSLGELGFERFQVPWIQFLVKEGIENAMFPTLSGQCIMHWINAIKDEGERQAMFQEYQRLAKHSSVIDKTVEVETDRDSDVCDDYPAHDTKHINPCSSAIDPTLAEWSLNF